VICSLGEQSADGAASDPGPLLDMAPRPLRAAGLADGMDLAAATAFIFSLHACGGPRGATNVYPNGNDCGTVNGN
jgi:hypothetical protein